MSTMLTLTTALLVALVTLTAAMIVSSSNSDSAPLKRIGISNFYTGDTSATLKEAEAICTKMGGRLSGLPDKIGVYQVAGHAPKNRLYWLAVKRIGNDKYYAYIAGKAVNYKPLWGKGEPRDDNNCAVVRTPMMEWYTKDCNTKEKFYFFCYKTAKPATIVSISNSYSAPLRRLGNSYFYTGDTKATLKEAEGICIKMGGRLSGLPDRKYMYQVAVLAPRNRLYWLAVKRLWRDKYYAYFAGKAVNYRPLWGKGEPRDNNNCAVVSIPRMEWYTKDCNTNEKFHFFCYKTTNPGWWKGR